MNNLISMVPGKGPKKPKYMIVGDKPFTQAEQLGLNQWLKILGVRKKAVYITTLFKFSDPNQELVPTPQNIHKWTPRLLEEIQTVDPKFVVTLGVTVAQAMMEFFIPTEQVIGRFSYDSKGIPIFHLDHPRILLANDEVETQKAVKHVENLKEWAPRWPA